MKMAKKRIKTGLPQRSFQALGPRLFAAKLLDFESSVKVKFLDQDQAWCELYRAITAERFCRF